MSEKKYERTSSEHLNHYLAFLEKHPELQASKMDPRNSNKIDDLWAKLADELNALKGPIRDPPKWRQTLTHWKHQLRSKARKAKVSKMLTGGGPPNSSVNLSDFEERALQKFGTTAVEGVPAIVTLGLEDETAVDNNLVEMEMEVEVLDEFQDSLEESSFSSLGMSSSSPILPNVEVISSARRTKRAKVTPDEVYTKIINLLESKNELDRKAAENQQKAEERQQQLQQQMMETQRMMAEAISKLGEGLTAISKLTEAMLKK